jgi:hypothetical protein
MDRQINIIVDSVSPRLIQDIQIITRSQSPLTTSMTIPHGRLNRTKSLFPDLDQRPYLPLFPVLIPMGQLCRSLIPVTHTRIRLNRTRSLCRRLARQLQWVTRRQLTPTISLCPHREVTSLQHTTVHHPTCSLPRRTGPPNLITRITRDEQYLHTTLMSMNQRPLIHPGTCRA